MSSRKQTKKRGYSTRNRVELVRGGHDYFMRLKNLIDEATFSVHLQYYIFLDDETGQMVMDTLKQAVQRGVTVFLQLDAYASQKLSNRYIRDMRSAGVKLRWFEPLFRSKHFYFGRRLHHKVVVADGIRALVGGINVCNRYNDMPDEPAWLDMAVYCEGEAAFSIYNTCREMWGEKRRTPAVKWETVNDFCESIPKEELVQVKVNRNDWVMRQNQIWRSYLDMFGRAEKEIRIMCSYFLPGKLSRRKLAQASRRGVKIRVILAGRSDIPAAKHAERYLYRWLFKNNIEIYEYQETVLHAKMSACDSNWVTIGSYNVNNISAYASLEMNLDIADETFALHAEKFMDEIISDHCQRITRETYESSTNFFRKLWQHFCYWLINNTLNLFTFYFKQKE